MGIDLVAMWNSMDLLARAVVVILGLLSVGSLSIAASRTLVYARAERQSLAFARQTEADFLAQRPDAVVAAAEQYPGSHLARVVVAGLTALPRLSQTLLFSEFQWVEAVNQATERATRRTRSDLQRGLGSLASIASISPFIGLLGTVLGIIKAFHSIGLEKSAGLGVISAGIAEALVTTAFGLIVAIPAAWMYNFLSGRLDRLHVDMQNAASEMVVYASQHYGSRVEIQGSQGTEFPQNGRGGA